MPKTCHIVCPRAALLLCALALLLCCALPLHAAAAQSYEAVPDIGAPRIVRVSCGVNRALYLDENGEVQGCCAEYLRKLADAANWELEYVEGSWNECVQMLLGGQLDLLLPTQKTESRADTMSFSAMIGGYQPVGIFAAADAAVFYEDFETFDGARIALSQGSSNEEALAAYAAKYDFTYTPLYLNTLGEKYDAVKNGDADLMVFSLLNDTTGFKLVGVVDTMPFYYAVARQNTALLEELDTAMMQLTVRDPAAAAQVMEQAPGPDCVIAFTHDENAVIERTDKLTIGYYAETDPLSGVDENGEPFGIYLDLLARIAQITGIEIEPYAVQRTDYAYDCLASGTIDFMIGSNSRAFELKTRGHYVKSDELMSYETVAVTRQDYRFSAGAAPRFALTSARRYWDEFITENYPGAEVQYYGTAKDCLVAVKDGSADATLLNTLEYNYQSKNRRFEDLIEWENVRIASGMVMTARADTDPLLLTILNKAIHRISSAEVESIVSSHLNVPYHSYDAADTLYESRDLLVNLSLAAVLLGCGFYIYHRSRRAHLLALEQKNAELQRASAAKTAFLSRMSHELRTPLNAITGYAALTRRALADPHPSLADVNENLDEVDHSARFLLAILNDILDMQTIESGRVQLREEQINAIDAMHTVIQMIRPAAAQKGVKFNYKRLSHAGEACITDGLRLQQILMNLLSNAIKFTPTGGTVTLTAESLDHDDTGCTLRFVVADTGVGISPEFLAHGLFETFAQENNDVSSPYEGSGLGLAIARRYARLMGGDITCESEKGRGSTFTLCIRVGRPAQQPAQKPAKKPFMVDLSGIRILLCEDNPMNQDITRRLLSRMGCAVDVADNGQRGVDIFNESAQAYYSMILMDIRMPVLDGWEATRCIRALPRPDAATVPILALSANAFEEDIRRSAEAGMNEHMAKPIDARLLCEKILIYCRSAG